MRSWNVRHVSLWANAAIFHLLFVIQALWTQLLLLPTVRIKQWWILFGLGECCRRKNAYHLVFPDNMSVDDKLLLTGSGILIDVTMFDNQDD